MAITQSTLLPIVVSAIGWSCPSPRSSGGPKAITTSGYSPVAIEPSPREAPPRLPRRGDPGDLLATVNQGGICHLWLCQTVKKDGTAIWAQVLLGHTFDGTE